MICAACGEATGSADVAGPLGPCPACGEAPALVVGDGWIRLDAVLGRGTSAVTYRATSFAAGSAPHTVAVKETPLPLAAGKAAELAAREASVLRQLDHPQIPRFVASLVAGRGKARSLYLVQEYVPGVDLRARLAAHRYTEAEVLEVVASLCPVLAYLHGLSPPVVHRDLKPANVILREDGAHVLVDFGAVRDALREGVGGSTVAGTFGYMAPEQFAGDAEPRSDLYALGALAVALLTRKDPAALAGHDRRLRWRDHAQVSDETAAILDALLAVDPRDRPASAEAVAESVRRAAAPPTDRIPLFDPSAPTVELPLPPPPRRPLALAIAGGLVSGGVGLVGAVAFGAATLSISVAPPGMGPQPVSAPMRWSLALPPGLDAAPVDVVYHQGLDALRAHDPRQALEHLYRVLHADPEFPAEKFAFVAGEQLVFDTLQPVVALRAADPALASARAAGFAWELESYVALEEGRYDEAVSTSLDQLSRPARPEVRRHALQRLRTAQVAVAADSHGVWTEAVLAEARGDLRLAVRLLLDLREAHPSNPSVAARLERLIPDP